MFLGQFPEKVDIQMGFFYWNKMLSRKNWSQGVFIFYKEKTIKKTFFYCYTCWDFELQLKHEFYKN